MNLNVDSWKYFKLSKLFDVSAGKYHYKDEYSDGNTPYCSATNDNNGVSQKINLNPDFTGNKIITGKIGCTAFYQHDDFCATSDVNVLTPKFNMKKEHGIFITTIINKNENFRWNYGRQCRVGNTNKISIKLPIIKDSDGAPYLDKDCKFSEDGFIPDFKFMESYIKNLNNIKISTSNISCSDKHAICLNDWKSFKFNDLGIDIYKSHSHVKNDLENYDYRKENYIPFVSRTYQNNSVDCWVPSDASKNLELGNAIVIGDTTASVSYQESNFITGDHIVIIRAPWLNKYIGLFIVTLLRLEMYRYSYGRSFKMDSIKNTFLKLPAKNDIPDWEYIEKYIKSMPYADII